jgi:hypothetical protein
MTYYLICKCHIKINCTEAKQCFDSGIFSHSLENNNVIWTASLKENDIDIKWSCMYKTDPTCLEQWFLLKTKTEKVIIKIWKLFLLF